MGAYRSHRYRSADGALDLFARDYPVRGARPEGAGGETGEAIPLLLMHGLTRNSADFEPLVRHLTDWRLIVPDQRGRGLSDFDPDPARYRIDVYAADMLALMDDLGIERFAIVGTSMGGLIGMAMVAMAPDRVAALALNDIGPVLDEAGMARIRAYVGPCGPAADWDEAARRIAAVNEAAFPNFTHSQWLAFARRTSRETPEGVVAAYDPAIAEGIAPGADADVSGDLWPVWELAADKPVLAVRGALSDLLSEATVAEMAARHAGPFAAVEVPERGHAPLLDEREVLAALLPFLHRYAR